MSTANASRRVPQEQIERARSVDLVHFLTQHLPPGELKRIGSQWTLRSHDSMRISADGRWNWFSQGVGGGDAISYLQSVENMSFIDAVQMLAGGNYISLTDAAVQNKPAERKPFELPPQNTESRRVFAYLRSRGIDGEIIKHCLQSGILYEDAKYHNAVFIGNDKTGQAKYAMLRGTVTGSTFKMEQTGSDKSCGFCMRGSGPTLFVCEAAIDALSVATLRKLGGRDWQRDSYLSYQAVQLDKIVTGTYNTRVSYKVVYRTNLNQTYRTLADNLDSTVNRTLQASPTALGLKSGEVVTDFMFVFGTVPAGFRSVDNPYVHGTVRKTAAGSSFVNKVDVGGLNSSQQWIMSNDAWTTTIYRTPTYTKPTLPKTGW